ncbi:ribbon-helix-helix domain-containing protein [Sulfurimonas sp.]|jgi:metal-responsive CopG/Arc/MetJ family transcriptional regulator|uniref:ribbon-helix-helix domain-containing protein n=1 Tax=Sulfurimonas sp. TaxID=2022749 RepID=UPI002600AF0E|nr:ribbon-helix-helix domain-containing protein [Sulfurimonas sp.]MCK9473081.1 ribbon-helix-helix domain-containing protein [Sulfurimonas sp.]MDD3505753.1 ribbon-helix-helix domain-containing protein [Sulfurimonas sp.]
MYTLSQLEKQQVGLRLPRYLIEEIDKLTQEYTLNRSDIITESIKVFISEQKAKEFYKNLDTSCKEMKDNSANQQTLQSLIDEL